MPEIPLEQLILIIAAVLTAVFLAPTFIKELLSFFLKPRLSIEYDEKQSSTFVPELGLVDQNGKQVCTQKYLRLLVKNEGRGIAHRCKAELQVIKEDTPFRAPSAEPKPLIWSGPSLEKDIGARHGKELLHAVFSDSRLSSIPDNTEDKNIYALVSTMESLYPKAPFIRAQDGFGEGNFKAEITITSEEGPFVKSTFRIHVEKDFHKLRMEKLS
jgi:hypothetical protein